MKVAYVISSKFDYENLICADAGPGFAEDYGWPAGTISRWRGESYDVHVVDHRFPADELDELRTFIDEQKGLFVLRLCDPYWEYARNHWWYGFVAEMLDRSRIHAMLNYQPAEITALFASRARRSQFVFAPYVYRAESELSLEHAHRRSAVLFSGARNRRLYPLRSEMARTAAWWVPLRLRSTMLEHPGYPDIGQRRRHAVIGGRYLELLSGFRFAAICSSRCRLEFLKYREFAYAGVVPVGDMPSTLLDCPTDAWIPWGGAH